MKCFPIVALTGNPRDARVIECLQILARALLAGGRKVLVTEGLGDGALPPEVERVSETGILERAKLAIAVGGDGSMLYAARHLAGTGIPLLGINRGRLGFLADLGPDQMLEQLGSICGGEYRSEERMLLRAELLQDTAVIATGLALNDVVVKRQDTGRMLEFQTFVDGHYVNTHGGDGFIVATPTGSTAYALSCGGPIVEPGLDALVLAPICPHTLSDRPLVIPAHRVAEVTLRPGHTDRAEVSCDGEVLGDLGPAARLRVAAAAERITLIHPPGYDYFQILRGKLLWGRDARVPPRAGD